MMKEILKNQLSDLADAFSDKSDRELEESILESCISLMSVVGKLRPTESLDESELDERAKKYQDFMDLAINPAVSKMTARFEESEKAKELIKQQEVLEAEIKKVAEADSKLEKLRKDCEDKRKDIDRLFEEHGDKFKEYVNLAKKHDYLKDKEREYAEIPYDALFEKTAELRVKVDSLKERSDKLDAVTAGILEDLSACLGEIGKNLPAFKDTVNENKEKADSFATSLTVCCEIYENYKAWFDELETPLKQFEKAVGKAEAEKLNGVLDKESLSEKHELFRTVGESLEKLEAFVGQCMKASQTDCLNVQKNAKG